MNINELKALEAVARSGSFTAAASELRADKARISRLIASLENRLGVRLLQRSTRSVSLTDVGRAVCERTRAALETLDEINAVAAQANAAPGGLLRITCGVEFGLIRSCAHSMNSSVDSAGRCERKRSYQLRMNLLGYLWITSYIKYRILKG